MTRKSRSVNSLHRSSPSGRKKGLLEMGRVLSHGRIPGRAAGEINDLETWVVELNGTEPESTRLLELISDYLHGEGLTVLDFSVLKTGEWSFVVDGLHGDQLGRVLRIAAGLVRGVPALELAKSESDQTETFATLKLLSRYWPELSRELTAYSELTG